MKNVLLFCFSHILICLSLLSFGVTLKKFGYLSLFELRLIIIENFLLFFHDDDRTFILRNIGRCLGHYYRI